MTTSKRLFFIALLPPPEIRQEITEIKQHFAEVYESRAALKSPPHITLQPPFKWEMEDVGQIEESLQTFVTTQGQIPVTLSGFGAFPPRVIYIKPLKTPELMAIQKALMSHLETSVGLVDKVSLTRPFSPHVTVAFRDLTKPNFRKAWKEYENKELHFEFFVSQLTLLLHNGKRWEVYREFPLISY